MVDNKLSSAAEKIGFHGKPQVASFTRTSSQGDKLEMFKVTAMSTVSQLSIFYMQYVNSH